jgi:hypothetical protein
MLGLYLPASHLMSILNNPDADIDMRRKRLLIDHNLFFARNQK